MSSLRKPVCEQVLGFSISADPFREQIDLILKWGHQRLSQIVCVANVHMLMEAYWDPTFAEVLSNSDLITPDGMPLVWTMNILRGKPHDRVAGIDILLNVCYRASREGLKVFFLGTDTETIQGIQKRLFQEFPQLQVVGLEPLPFRPLTPEEDSQLTRRINDSGAGILFLALGCPKQEIWMSHHKNKIQAVMIGVGGVFPVYAGLKTLAPDWIRYSGLEWLYRLAQEPRRLWKRYSTTIPPFIYLSTRQILGRKLLQATLALRRNKRGMSHNSP